MYHLTNLSAMLANHIILKKMSIYGVLCMLQLVLLTLSTKTASKTLERLRF